MSTIKSKCRVSFALSDGKIDGIQFREPNPEGKFVDVERPWRSRDLVHLRKAGQAANLMGRGVSDLREVKERVNAPRTPQREVVKPNSVASRTVRRRR